MTLLEREDHEDVLVLGASMHILLYNPQTMEFIGETNEGLSFPA